MKLKICILLLFIFLFYIPILSVFLFRYLNIPGIEHIIIIIITIIIEVFIIYLIGKLFIKTIETKREIKHKK